MWGRGRAGGRHAVPVRYEVTVEIEARPEVVWAVIWRVTELEPGSRFAWDTRTPGLRSVGDHAVTRLDDRRSRALLAIDQTGPPAPLAGLLYGRLIRRYLAMESAGLKRRCEEGWRGATRVL
jgi:hypothetical protein